MIETQSWNITIKSCEKMNSCFKYFLSLFIQQHHHDYVIWYMQGIPLTLSCMAQSHHMPVTISHTYFIQQYLSSDYQLGILLLVHYSRRGKRRLLHDPFDSPDHLENMKTATYCLHFLSYVLFGFTWKLKSAWLFK